MLETLAKREPLAPEVRTTAPLTLSNSLIPDNFDIFGEISPKKKTGMRGGGHQNAFDPIHRNIGSKYDISITSTVGHPILNPPGAGKRCRYYPRTALGLDMIIIYKVQHVLV